jgi:hypothetical protein
LWPDQPGFFRNLPSAPAGRSSGKGLNEHPLKCLNPFGVDIATSPLAVEQVRQLELDLLHQSVLRIRQDRLFAVGELSEILHIHDELEQLA